MSISTDFNHYPLPRCAYPSRPHSDTPVAVGDVWRHNSFDLHVVVVAIEHCAIFVRAYDDTIDKQFPISLGQLRYKYHVPLIQPRTLHGQG
jgi:hypothetical protein